jgi:hypothetical protein
VRAQIRTNAVKKSEIAKHAVGRWEILPNGVDRSEIRRDAVGPSELRGNAVSSDEIQDGTLQADDLSAAGKTALAALNGVKTGTTIEAPAANARLVTASPSTDVSKVVVNTAQADGTAIDSAFHLLVAC